MRVKGWGPSHATLALVSNRPNYEEARTGKALTGRKIVEELEMLLGDVPLTSCYRTTLYREEKGKEYAYTSADLERDGAELLEELAQAQPDTIVAMGRDAARFFLGDVDLDEVWGLPWLTDAHGVVFVCFHPNQAIHQSDIAPYVIESFRVLQQYLNGDLLPRRLHEDPHPNPDYQEVTHATALRLELAHLPQAHRVGLDSEGWTYAPWSIQYSTAIGTGRLIRACDANQHALVRTFMAEAQKRQLTLVFHSVLHEFKIFDAMGVEWNGPFEDSMVAAYLLCLEPQSLKQGATRLCGMKMQSFSDLMGDIENIRARDYLTWIWDLEVWEHQRRCEAEFQARLDAGRRVKKVPTLPKTKLHKAVERCLSSKAPARLWGDQDDAIQSAGVQVVGPLPQPTLDDIEPERALLYAARDPDATLRYHAALMPKIKAMGLEDVYRLELSTYPLIARMSKIGLKPDLRHFAKLSIRLGEEIADLQQTLDGLTGRVGFNANSGDQVSEYLFDKLGISEGKRTSSGRGSTGKKILKDLMVEYPEHPEIQVILDYREYAKLKHSFVDVVPELIKGWPHDGRVHPEFRTTRIPTGRLAATMPEGFPKFNILALPKRGKFAKDFRKGWIPEDGHVLCEWDLSQIELRIAAHLCQDPYMLSVYRGEVRNPDGSKIDLHSVLVHRIFGVSKKDETNVQRVVGKSLNFSYWMGTTPIGLQVTLRAEGQDVSQDDCQRWLDDFDKTFPMAPIYKQHRIDEARKNGFVRSMGGRIRYIGGINSRDERVRAEAERFAFSTPIQTGAQTLMKQAEAAIWQEILVPNRKRGGPYLELLLQCHDALTAESVDDPMFLRDFNQQMCAIMTRTPRGFSVPVETSGDWGYNWADMVPFD